MNALISGYSPTTVIRSHQQRLDDMRRHHPANLFAKEWGKRGTMVREPKAFKEAIARRDDRNLITPSADFLAKMAKMRDVCGAPKAAFRLSISSSTIERLLAGGRMRDPLYQRLLVAIEKPYERPSTAKVKPTAEFVEAVRAVIAEEGSLKSTTKRLQVGFHQLASMLAGGMLSVSVLERMKSRLTYKPAGWVSGAERLRAAIEKRKASFHADSCKRVAKAAATKQRSHVLRTITVAPNELVERLDAIVAEMGAVPAAEVLQVSYNALRRLRTREPVRRCTVVAVERSLARRAA